MTTHTRPPRPADAKPWTVWDTYARQWVDDPMGDIFDWFVDDLGDAHPIVFWTVRCHAQISTTERCANMYRCDAHT